MSEKDWYVTVGDNQVGPVDTTEIKDLWMRREITEDSHVWHPSMDDWAPIVNATALSDILKKNPHIKKESVKLKQLDREWRPTAAVALQDLMEQELVEPEPEKKPGPLFPDFEMAVDLFPSTPSFNVPVIPEEREKTTGRWVVPALSIIAVGILVTGFFAFEKAQQAETIRELKEFKQAVATKPELPPIPKLVPVVEQPIEEKPAVVEKPRKRRWTKKEKKPEAQQLKELTVKQIVAGVKKQFRSIKKCIATAHSQNELGKGKHILRLSWTIETNGSVSQPRVTGPPDLAKTSLGKCVPASMSRWKFPKSSKASPVKNFPLGPFTIR